MTSTEMAAHNSRRYRFAQYKGQARLRVSDWADHMFEPHGAYFKRLAIGIKPDGPYTTVIEGESFRENAR